MKNLNWQVKKIENSILLEKGKAASVTINCSCLFAWSDLFCPLKGISRRPENVKFDKGMCFEEVVLTLF